MWHAGGGGLGVRINKVAEKAKSLLFEPGDTLSQRVVRSGPWVFALHIASRGLTLICTIILARALAPSDFGLMGIALLSMSILETFSQMASRRPWTPQARFRLQFSRSDGRLPCWRG